MKILSFKRLNLDKMEKEVLRQELVALLPRLRRFARGLTKDPVIADDLVQDACERALERLDQVRKGTRFDSWMFRIIQTRWIDCLRKKKVRFEHLSLVGDKDSSDSIVDGSTGSPDENIDIKRALKTLPDDQISAVMLVCIEGYSYSEAAKILEVPSGTVASRVGRGRIQLGKVLFSRAEGERNEQEVREE
ncbi:conserved protein of unknown function [Pseudodesulfovibrio profundus]|uniref:RNA polymerase, sigma-24 subunit, ECF subfamily n=1 Tax=Pseudodesulfovibrio profundus TaxID=57320 RepID=A0A2C8F7U7_9BACT|nr:RNA polymerase sigma factor [Pseudodesulfovibrio profundus]SOB58517.1 conserved protein of unknown function [Pseudodesulfovibrio profundus]